MEDFIIKSSYDGLELSCTSYIIPKAKANILIIHGMIEHRKRYNDFAKFLNDKGYNVYSYDKRGHGKSINKEITHGYFGKGMDEALSIDLLDIVAYIKNSSNLPLHLFAHSMGTIETRCFMQLNSHLVNKIILSGAPNYQGATKLGILIAKLFSLGNGEKKSSKFIYNLSLGSFAKKIRNRKTNLDWLSFNEENINNYRNDPYCTFSFTNNGYLTLFKLVNNMHKSRNYLSTKENPILFIYGSDDPCTGYDKGINNSINTLKKAGYKEISNIKLENMRHEILQEKDYQKVYDLVASFYEG